MFLGYTEIIIGKWWWRGNNYYLIQTRTSFIIAHRLSTIRDADHMIVINDVEIAEQGTYQLLLDKRGFFHHLYMSQFTEQQI